MADQNAVQLNYDLTPSPQVASQLQQQMAQLEKSLRFKGPFGPAARETRDFSSELDRANQRVITLGASFTVLATSIRSLKEIARSTIEVEQALTDINAVLGASSQQLDRFSKQLFDVSRNAAVPFQKAADAAKELVRQGLPMEETLKRTSDALILSRLSGLSAKEAIDALTSSINGFAKEGLKSSDIVNRLAKLDAAYAVSSKDLGEALVRVGSAAQDAGVSFNELMGLVTAARQITGRDGSVIAQALNTIFTRVARGGTLDDLESLGVTIRDLRTNEVLPMVQILGNFAQTYDKLGGATKTWAAELVGGVRNLNTLKALLDDLSRSNSVFSQTQRDVAGSTNEAYQRNEDMNRSLGSMLERLRAAATQIGRNIGSQSFEGPFKALGNIALENPITKMLEDASGKAETTGGKIGEGLIRGIGNALIFGLGPFVAKALGKITFATYRNLSTDFSSLAGLSTESQANARIQSEIVSLYRAGGAALQQQLAAMSGIAERAAYVQRLLSAGATNPNNPATMASAVVALRRGRTPGAAEGYVPMAEEAKAIAAGVGGAPGNARPVFLPGFDRGGGQRGIVANTSEFFVPGAAGGAIFNREMIQKYGLPPGAKPVAAGGFIPNAAGAFGIGPGPNSLYNLVPSSVLGQQALPPYVPATSNPSAGGYGGFFSLYNPANSPNSADAQKRAAEEAAKAAAAVENRSRAEAFALAQKELARREALEDKAAARKVKELAQMEAMLEKERALNEKRRTLTEADLKNADRALSAARAQQQAERDETKRLRAARTTPVLIPSTKNNVGTGYDPITGLETSESYQARIAAMRLAPSSYGTAMLPGMAGRAVSQEVLARELSSGALAAPGLRARQQAIRAAATTSSGGGSSWFSRLSGSPNAGLIAGLTLPFVGGFIPEGRGGTPGGAGLGALSNGLSGAGFGASLGSIGGPLGTAGGAAVGAIAGGLYGALNKIEVSFEELSRRIQENNEKIGNQVSVTGEIFRLKDDLENAVRNRASPEQISTIQRSLDRAFSSIHDPQLKSILTSKSPDALRNANQYNQGMSNTQAGGSNLIRAVERAYSTSSTGGFYGYGPGATSTIAEAISPILANASPEQQKFFADLARKDPSKALRSIGAITGLNTQEQNELTGRADNFFTKGGSVAKLQTRNLFESSILEALDKVRKDGLQKFSRGATEAAAAAVKFDETLEDMSSRFQIAARNTQIIGESVTRLRNVRQGIATQNPFLTDVERLSLSGGFERQNILEQAVFQRSGILSTGKSSLVDVVKGLPQRPDSEALRARIEGISSLGDAKGFRDFLTSQAGVEQFRGVGGKNSPFIKALDDLIERLSALETTTDRAVQVSTESNRLQLDWLRFMKTAAGARLEYSGAARNSADAFRTGLTRGDTPDRLLALSTNSSLAALDDEYNRRLHQNRTDTGLGNFGASNRTLLQMEREPSILRGAPTYGDYLFPLGGMGSGFGPMGRGAYHGRRAGINANAQATQVENEAAAIEYLLQNPSSQGARDLTGDQITSGLSGGARMRGIRGDAKGSFLGGFRASVEGAKRDLMDFSAAGRDTFESLRGNATNFWMEWVTGAKQGKDAFKGFVASVAADASRMFANKAFTAVLSAIPGFGLPAGATGGEFTGSRFRFAGGGKVPALLTGGEIYIGPNAARSIGYERLRAINSGSQHLAAGGMADVRMIRGGSGVRDDVPATLPSGSFIIKKSTAQRLGPDYFRALAGGQVQHRFLGGLLSSLWGGTLAGAVVGGGLGYAVGGKKGALGGALLGGLAGGFYGSQAGQVPAGWRDVGGIQATSSPTTLNVGTKALLGLGASAGLGLLAAGLTSSPGGTSTVDLTNPKPPAGQFTYLSANANGGYSLGGFGPAVATRRWAEGGGVDLPMLPAGGGSSGGGDPQVYIKIDINNQGGVSSSTSKSGGKGEPFGEGSAGRLEKMVKGWVKEEIVRQSEPDGFFAQRSRFVR